jgi:hypothetical protein
MKRIRSFRLVIAAFTSFAFPSNSSYAQSNEMQQLLLNIEKLTQFKALLSDMKKGYHIYQQGYGVISNMSKGNFDLHDVYLNGLMAVSPAVRNNPRISQIISQQSDIVTEYKKYRALFRKSGSFRSNELLYIESVFDQLVNVSNSNVDELANVATAGKLRMSDDDRLRSVDRIYNTSTEQLQFLRYFNRQAIKLSLQRAKDVRENNSLRRLYGLN